MVSQIILASGSPRRRQLLAEAGIDFQVILSPAEEIHDCSMVFSALCEHNAQLKARAVAQDHPHACVIGADTLVCIDGEPLGKPIDGSSARAMLRRLSGRINQVCTGVCLCGPQGREIVFHELTEVRFRVLSEQTITEYMSLVHTLDKAGGYAAQESGDLIIEEIRGDFTNVVGLPMARLLQELGRC